MLPWRYTDSLTTLHHLRLNLYLPNPYDRRLWEDTLPQRLNQFIQAIDNGERLRDLEILIATWYHFHDLSTRQATALGIFEQMNMRGHVQVKARSIDEKLRVALKDLNLTDKVREGGIPQAPGICHRSFRVADGDMDWEWEGGVVI
jgi:hypothetical protein